MPFPAVCRKFAPAVQGSPTLAPLPIVAAIFNDVIVRQHSDGQNPPKVFVPALMRAVGSWWTDMRDYKEVGRKCDSLEL